MPSDDAQSQLQTSSDAALEPYKQLRSLHTSLARRHEDAEQAAPQLLYHVELIARDLRANILAAFAADLEKVLKTIRWPSPKAVVPSELQDEWETALVKLLELQMPELEGAADARGPAILFPFEVLARPLEMRFRYHFEGDKPTNRIDRPEYFLSHIITLLNDYNGFMADFVQPVLLKQFRGTDLALNPVYIDATAAFITALLPMLRAKIGALLPKVAGQPQLLSHLMHEVMSFDTTIREEWKYDGGYGLDGWKGLSWEFLVQGDWFGRWLQVEKDCAKIHGRMRLSSKLTSKQSRWHDTKASSTPPTSVISTTKASIRKPQNPPRARFASMTYWKQSQVPSAILVLTLALTRVVDRYRPLTSFSQKLRFVIDIQIAIFDKLHERLKSNLDAYRMARTTLGRAVGGVSKEEQDKSVGIDGLERLCKTYGSADYIERAMRDWSDDVVSYRLLLLGT